MNPPRLVAWLAGLWGALALGCADAPIALGQGAGRNPGPAAAADVAADVAGEGEEARERSPAPAGPADRPGASSPLPPLPDAGDAASPGEGPHDPPHDPPYLEAPTADAGPTSLPNDVPLGPPYPIVFVHGFSGFAEIGPVDYFFRVLDDLRARGHEVSAPALPPVADSDARADVLAAHIDAVLRESGRARVHLVAHSQGGIDGRRLLARNDAYRTRVASLTTIATPHRGTPLADDAALLPEGWLSPTGRFWAWLVGVADTSGDGAALDASDAGVASAPTDLADVVAQLSAPGMARFNEENPDPPQVRIYSIAGYSNLQSAPALCAQGSLFLPTQGVDAMDPLLLASGLLLAGPQSFAPRANDGVVPTDSMPWGTFLGCVPADHLDQIGQVADLFPQLVSGFDHLEMYRTLVDFLRRSEGAGTP